ncbi:Rossmann-like and DUF2520 domain-containing protein [Mangrovibacterium marinum]|uniref:Putative short-subunit dehydrogenase-like oxidoreductase (DUF2520 family) n=1 Tax=Mangrovibacterium marinum TaxID=1639118 RepID=A0A2T5C560_9BACT|nr:Rossmann-like and DUF2520 domain-containing protein [Mangrovibacterium marinum]PTN09977.1 putative short-subunit dehydrogenase-like oxidoreductase (DUF2520 family) [Mangrovibacterium marinum]
MIQKVTLVGAGNLATQLGKALYKSGIDILQVYSRTKSSAELLAKQLGSQATNELHELNMQADLYIFALKDDALERILKQIDVRGKFIVHTAGSLPMRILQPYSDSYGVFYPLQTFSKQRDVAFEQIPMCLEAARPELLAELKKLAERLSGKVEEISSAQRQSLHLAAVFTNNFVNHFYHLSHQIVKKYGVDFELLKPLITETAAKVMEIDPFDAQTGPAKRFDEAIIQKHLNFLSDQPELQEIYSFVSKSIFEAHKSK